MLLWRLVSYKNCLRGVLRTFVILVASVMGGCLDAVVFLLVLDSTLPPTDWAYHPNSNGVQPYLLADREIFSSCSP
jgi:hypothetical protein